MHDAVCRRAGNVAGLRLVRIGPVAWGRQSEPPPRLCGSCCWEQGEYRLCGAGRRPMCSLGIVTASVELFSRLAAPGAGAEASAHEREETCLWSPGPSGQASHAHRPAHWPIWRGCSRGRGSAERSVLAPKPAGPVDVPPAGMPPLLAFVTWVLA